jgi:hypothetical protein
MGDWSRRRPEGVMARETKNTRSSAAKKTARVSERCQPRPHDQTLRTAFKFVYLFAAVNSKE